MKHKGLRTLIFSHFAKHRRVLLWFTWLQLVEYWWFWAGHSIVTIIIVYFFCRDACRSDCLSLCRSEIFTRWNGIQPRLVLSVMTPPPCLYIIFCVPLSPKGFASMVCPRDASFLKSWPEFSISLYTLGLEPSLACTLDGSLSSWSKPLEEVAKPCKVL